MADVAPFLTRVVLKNYKSIAFSEVELRPLTFLVGPNGSGKSNFLDALRFTSDALRNSLDNALRERGGIGEVRRRSGGHPNHFGIRLEFQGPAGEGHYAFQIGARPSGGYDVQTEECEIRGLAGGRFKVESGEVQLFELASKQGQRVPPAASRDRLYLVNTSGVAEFRPVYDALSRASFYNLNPDRIREFQPPDSGEILARDGGNLTSVLRQLSTHDQARKKRIEEYLSSIVPSVSGVEVKDVPPQATLEFRHVVAGAKNPWRFFAGNMSDGTLRALGILVALFQAERAGGGKIPLVGIEEPEIALHPAAVEALLGALREAARFTQVIVTTHSPELLDAADIENELLLAVQAEEGNTQIAPVDDVSREAVRKGLYTPGELLRQNQLRPARLFGTAAPRQQSLFGGGGE